MPATLPDLLRQLRVVIAAVENMPDGTDYLRDAGCELERLHHIGQETGLMRFSFHRDTHPLKPFAYASMVYPNHVAGRDMSRRFVGVENPLAMTTLLKTWEAHLAPALLTGGERQTKAAAPATTADATPAKPKLSKKAKALAALADKPEWTDEKIADAAGCHVKSLYRWKAYGIAREVLREGRDGLPKGTKRGDTGDVEAWHECEADPDADPDNDE